MLSAMALCASSQVSATAQPTSLIPVIGTQAVMPVTAPLTTAFNFQLLLFFHMHMYVPTHIPHNLLNLKVCGTGPKRQKAGKEKMK